MSNTMTADEIKNVLEKHRKWLDNEAGGERADLRGANFEGADLRGANLNGANLWGANLSGANLVEANLSRANLSRADLSGANLKGAELTKAYLKGAYLSETNLSGANLSGANFEGANLVEADLSGANLYGADLTGANLTEANLSGADLTGANLPPFQIVPEVGAFFGWKKLANGAIAQLEIPAKAKRTSSLVGRKCRASYAKTVAITAPNGEPMKEGFTCRDGKNTVYRVGRLTRPDKYDDNVRVACTHGVHFFITKQEAEDYGN